MDRADLLLIAMDGGDAVSHEERRLLASPGRKLAVVCKSDLSDGAAAFALAKEYGVEAIGVSAVTGEGVGALIDRIAELIAPECESALVTNLSLIHIYKILLINFNIKSGIFQWLLL